MRMFNRKAWCSFHFLFRLSAAALSCAVSSFVSAQIDSAEALLSPNLGTIVEQQEIEALDLIASAESPLPVGSGTAFQGREIYANQCAACHGADGKGGAANQPLVGGNIQSADRPLRTVGSFWPHATTLFDFVRRAMPANAPKSLSDTEVYQVVAYVLYMNGLIDQYKIIDADSLAGIKMPNSDGFIDMSAQ